MKGRRVVIRCRGKVRYESKRVCEAAMKHALRSRGRHSRPEFLRGYHCPRCNGWHMTKQEEREE